MRRRLVVDVCVGCGCLVLARPLASLEVRAETVCEGCGPLPAGELARAARAAVPVPELARHAAAVRKAERS